VIVSENRYDWLGAGAYFWENSPDRAMEWAHFLTQHPQNPEHNIAKPFVVGAVIDLGNCLDLSDAGSLEIIKEAYAKFKKTSDRPRDSALKRQLVAKTIWQIAAVVA
jgi:hypothetical protein